MKQRYLTLGVTFFAIASFIGLSCSEGGQASKQEALYTGFLDPPQEARPRVWWHWMNGNVTKAGIRKDLLWMHRNGIGGFQNFDAGLSTPQVVPERLTYMTPEWKEAFAYATQLADSLQLEMAIAGSPGWSQTGGPWVPAEDGMKKLVWRELRVRGGQAFRGQLPEPDAATGEFQNVPLPEGNATFSGETAPPPQYYQDIAVIAYRLPGEEVLLADLNPRITASSGTFTLAQLTDGDLATTNLLPRDDPKGYAWIQYAFTRPQTIRAVTVVGGPVRDQWTAVPPANDRSLEVSDDGINYRRVSYIPVGGVAQQTVTIPETTSKYFRITFNNPPPPKYAALLPGGWQPTPGTEIAELVLHPTTRINHAEEKAAFAAVYDLEKYPTPKASAPIAPTDIIVLTDKFQGGTLEWSVPDGNWKILRFGYSLTGKKNHPASPEATGLEVDKLDTRAVRDYFENYLDQYAAATGGLMGSRGLQYIITDSYEAGQMTWTPGMAEEFEARRGYRLTPWMPVLTGLIVESTEASEGFLWDWRKTISELIAENHYDQLTDILAERGMGRYTESHENGRLYIVDGMDVKRTAAVPMSAMWMPGGWGSTPEMAQADIRESASVAHIYGQNLAAAESLTAMGMMGGAWSYAPENLKPTADLELASGLNRFVIHTSVHQPVDDKIPGLGLFIFGQWFTRHETWADQARAWTDYLARSSFMLQRGKFVADVLYYYGEDNNITGLFGHQLPDVPEGYSFDFINPHALMDLLSVGDGRLVTPSGMSYHLLHLDANARRMSLPVLNKLAELIKDGAVVSGQKPELLAGLSSDASEFTALVEEIWKPDTYRVYPGASVGEALAELAVAPDFAYTKPREDTKLLYVHRQLDNEEIYWVNNRNDRQETVEATFRVTGKVPEIWHPETGERTAAAYTIMDEHTRVKLPLKPNDAVFVVFNKKATATSVSLPPVETKEVVSIDGPWEVTFQPGRGAPAGATFDQLAAYTEHSDQGIKYFSGTATYTKTIVVPESVIAEGAPLYLDLGAVKDLAEITVNGKALGVIWKKPFRVLISEVLQAGENKLEIKVVNLWVNRLIGDAQPDVREKITYTTMPFYNAESPLRPAGLLGPVRVVSVK